MLGWMDREGNFYGCSHSFHGLKAKALLEEKYGIVDAIRAEDVLLDKHWVCICSDKAYYNYYGDDKKFVPLTSAQIVALRRHEIRADVTNYGLIMSIDTIINNSVLYIVSENYARGL